MSGFRVQTAAVERIDEIYRYTERAWGADQAARYIRGLFARFEAIAARHVVWRAIPAEFGVEGFLCRYEQHLIYWKILGDGDVGIVTVLHERMHQIERFRQDFEG